MQILIRVELNRHGRQAGIHSYSFNDDYPHAPLKIRLAVGSGQMDIDAGDLDILDKAIQLFKAGERI